MSNQSDMPTHWSGLNIRFDGQPACGCGPGLGQITLFPSDVTCPNCRGLLALARDAMEAKAKIADPAPVTGDQLAPPESLVGPAIDVAMQQRADAIHGKPLTAQQLQRLGAIMPDGVVPSMARAEHLEMQRRNYHAYSKADLIDEIIRRDESEILRGQDAASGRLMSRLIREFLRGVLYAVDANELRTINHGDKTTVVEKLLQAMGTEPADARQLRIEGSMVGNIRDARPADEAIESPLVPQLPSPETADAIREQRNRMVPRELAHPRVQGTNDNAD